MRMKSFVILLAFILLVACSAKAQPVAANAPYLVPTVVTNIVYVTNSAPSLDLNPADYIDVLPPKYQKLGMLILTLLLAGGRIWATRQAGGSIGNGLANLVLGHSQAVKNEIAQLKVATGLSQAPAPPVGGVLVVPTPPAPGTAVPVVPTAADRLIL